MHSHVLYGAWNNIAWVTPLGIQNINIILNCLTFSLTKTQHQTALRIGNGVNISSWDDNRLAVVLW